MLMRRATPIASGEHQRDYEALFQTNLPNNFSEQLYRFTKICRFLRSLPNLNHGFNISKTLKIKVQDLPQLTGPGCYC